MADEIIGFARCKSCLTNLVLSTLNGWQHQTPIENCLYPIPKVTPPSWKTANLAPDVEGRDL